MSRYVQAFDPNDRCYVVYEVATGKEVERRTAAYKMDEIEPLPRDVPERPVAYDPLGDFR